MKLNSERTKLNRSLEALYLVVDESVARDVARNVQDYIDTLDADLTLAVKALESVTMSASLKEAKDVADE